MALLQNRNPSLFDIANMPENADAKDVIDLMAQSNPMLTDAVAFPCNDGTYHKTTVLVGLPTNFWGRYYKGIPTSKAARQMVKDTTGFLESAAQVDKRIIEDIEAAEEKASIRLDEALRHIESMGQTVARALIYSDSAVNPDQPTGLAPRFNMRSGAENSTQVVHGGGTAGSDMTSIWMITWDKNTVHLIYPNKGKAGLQRENDGVVQVADENNNLYPVYRETFRWHVGLTVRDWRYVVRVCNIDISELTVDASAGANLINLMTEMYYRHYGRRMAKGKTYIYASTSIVKFLDYQARNAVKNLFLTFDNSGVNASEVLKFRGIPIRECDAILETEEVIAA